MSQPPRDTAPHERVFAGDPWPYSQTIRSDCRVSIGGVTVYTPADWPDDDGPVSPLELWALRQARTIPHGEVTLFKRDGEICRVEKRESVIAPEGR